MVLFGLEKKKTITERKNIQARLQEAQKMSGIAHEFNNALCAGKSPNCWPMPEGGNIDLSKYP